MTKPSVFAPISYRIKAFLIDIFMIYTPILYISGYVFLDGKSEFLQNQFVILFDSLLFGVILSIFIAKTSQTPGMRAYEICVINKDESKVSFLKAFLRYLCFLGVGASFVALFVPFFRKDKNNLHDLICKTQIIKKPSILS